MDDEEYEDEEIDVPQFAEDLENLKGILDTNDFDYWWSPETGFVMTTADGSEIEEGLDILIDMAEMQRRAIEAWINTNPQYLWWNRIPKSDFLTYFVGPIVIALLPKAMRTPFVYVNAAAALVVIAFKYVPEILENPKVMEHFIKEIEDDEEI